MGDHDGLFKRVFSVPAHAAGELRAVLPPEIASELDLEALRLVPSSFVDAEMAHRHADLLFRAPRRGGNEHVFLYLLLEHQSQPDRWMPWRVLSYPQIELIVDDLANVPDAELRHRVLAPLPKVALWLLRDGRSIATFFEHLQTWGAELEHLARSGIDAADMTLLVRYILRVAGQGPHETLRQRIIDVSPTFGEAFSPVELELIEKGVQQGARDALTRLLMLRFGALAPDARAKIDAAPRDVLDRWFDRAVTATSLADVFAA